MNRSSYLFTSESVAEGHPDKVCDRISDEIVDGYFRAAAAQGVNAHDVRVAVETLATTNLVVLAGEVRGPKLHRRDLTDIVRAAVRDIGYEQDGFHHADLQVLSHIHAQSEEIGQGVDTATNADAGAGAIGAGDQGIMFGHATDETPALMPAPIYYSHKILKSMADARRSGARPEFEPDAKSQVTLRYEGGKPVAAASVVVSTQHAKGFDQGALRELVRGFVTDTLPDGWMCPDEEFYVNPTGVFAIGGPDGDAGLTGRKIIVDTYGGAAPHGGGAFSGKDPTKVDRSAAYACRYLAKNVVAAGLASNCTIQISYAIGVSKPLSLYVDLYGQVNCDPTALEQRLPEIMDLSPGGIRDHLQLTKPIYARTAAYGHFGREPDADGGFSWERTDLVDSLKDLLS